jgi:hypothetical protein
MSTPRHTGGGCQNVVREEIGFFGFSIRSASYRYTEWHPWSKGEEDAKLAQKLGQLQPFV